METVSKASVKTELRLGLVKEPVSLYKTMGSETKARSWDKAGPEGGVLRVKEIAVEKTEEETPDALGITPVKDEPEPEAAEDPGPEEAPPVEAPGSPVPAQTRPAETKMILVEEGDEKEAEVLPEEVLRGIRLDDGEFVDLTQHLADAELESRAEGLETLGFLRRERVPRERVISSYFLAGDSADALKTVRTLYEGMKESGRVAVVRWTKRKGQSLGILSPRGDGAMVILELAFAEVCRAPNAKCLGHLRAEVTRGTVDAAVQLIDKMNWSPDQLDEIRNRRVELEEELIERAEDGKIEGYTPPELKADPALEELATLLKRSA